ncbi:MAG: hypothetical protein LAP87_22045 [Acidobacteriia bacterium]|nr:hypothetical protein [Terriglobia bacterium]
MKSLLLCLALAAWPVIGEQRGESVAPIALYTQFQQEPPPAVVESLHEELESIMAPMGLHFEWRSLSGSHGNEVSAELAVITFKGRCDTAGLVSRRVNPGALGWTHISDGVILPFSDVDCDRIRGFIQKELLALDHLDRVAAFGRAVGRVVAHELYHIFANTQHHGADGVAKAAYTAQELVADDFQFEEKEMLALRGGKVHALVEHTATGTPPL